MNISSKKQLPETLASLKQPANPLTRQITNHSGFSLIELMIVVAIIGILATIAIPNYMHMVEKARQSEAKTNLSALYASEMAFKAEWMAYTGDFRDIGLMLEGSLRYDVGFGGAGYQPPAPFNPASSAVCESGTAYNTEVSACAIAPGSFQAPALFSPAAASASCPAALDPTPTAFRASAVGLLGAGHSGTTDVWTMDDQRSLCHNQDGMN